MASILGASVMYTLDLSRFRRVNIWLDEPPPAAFESSSALTRIIKPRLIIAASRRIAAIEMLIPHGGKTSYALLGGELTETGTEYLEVSVKTSPLGQPFNSTLASKPEEVIVGLR
jgi:hypothetical protein